MAIVCGEISLVISVVRGLPERMVSRFGCCDNVTWPSAGLIDVANTNSHVTLGILPTRFWQHRCYFIVELINNDSFSCAFKYHCLSPAFSNFFNAHKFLKIS